MSTFCCYPLESTYALDKADPDTAKPLLPQPIQEATVVEDNQYPGLLRSINTAAPPKNTTFVKTGGNALQAVNNTVLDDQKNLVQVVVPDNNMKPGDVLHVLAPDGSGRLIAARIPEGCSAGSVFFVNSMDYLPVATTVTGVVDNDHKDDDLVVVNSVDVATQQLPEQDLELADESLVLVRVPQGSRPGDLVRVELPDGRVVEAIVPEGSVSEIYVRAPPIQGHQSNSLLPMIV